MSKRMIFHIPVDLDSAIASGSQIRPVKMRNAFEELGYEVVAISGNALERKKRIKALKQRIKQGEKFEFMYAENSNDPTLLAESHHLPLHPFLDYGLFSFCRKQGIPIGLFYRDIYWNFPFYKDELSWFKRVVAKFFHHYDLRQYRKYLNIFYLPSMQMLKYIPGQFNMRVEALPPGGKEMNEEQLLSTVKLDDKQPIELLYIGGLGHLYRLDLLVEAISKRASFSLTICCREKEWTINKDRYEQFLGAKNIKVVHKSGEGLNELFREAHITSIYLEPSEYRSFAMPVKLFEYLQNARPILSSSGCAVADFVVENDVGWSVDYTKKALEQYLDHLENHRDEIITKSQRMPAVLKNNSWKFRAKKVAAELSEASR